MYDSSGPRPIRTWRSVPSLEATTHLELPHESTAPHARLAACPTRGPVSKSKQGDCAELLMQWSNFQCCRHLKRPRSVVSTRHSVCSSTPSFTRASFLVGLELQKKNTIEPKQQRRRHILGGVCCSGLCEVFRICVCSGLCVSSGWLVSGVMFWILCCVVFRIMCSLFWMVCYAVFWIMCNILSIMCAFWIMCCLVLWIMCSISDYVLFVFIWITYNVLDDVLFPMQPNYLGHGTR